MLFYLDLLPPLGGLLEQDVGELVAAGLGQLVAQQVVIVLVRQVVRHDLRCGVEGLSSVIVTLSIIMTSVYVASWYTM